MKKRIHSTGDLNLAASLMTLGIPLDDTKPVSLVALTNGKDYKSFHLEFISYCGKYDVFEMSDAWNNPEQFTSSNPKHPFAKLMGFIRSARGSRTASDWLECAAKYLQTSNDAVRRAYGALKQVCDESPESEVSYILAFINNRQYLISLIHEMDKNGNFDVMQSIGKSIITMGAKQDKRTKDYLMSHVRN